ncbi:MAG: PilN domain-containing protein [Smithellaceae bacterium]
MIKINLLPYREKAKKDNISRQITIIAGLFILFLLCLAWVYIYMLSQVKNLETQLAASKQTLQVLDEKVGNLDKFKAKKADLELKLGVIGTLEENRLLPVKTLDNLSLLVPQDRIWLTKITQSGDSLKIEGIGRDNIAAADFMKTIENFAPIQSVDLNSSKKKDIADMTFQEFIFSCKMKKGF